jgi:hypothetical protein
MTDSAPKTTSADPMAPDPMGDLESTLNLLQQIQQDAASASPAIAVMLIERWEEQLQGTDLFDSLSALRQAILNGHDTEIALHLKQLSEKTAAYGAQMHEQGSAEAVQIEQVSQLLSQASQIP